MKPSSLTPLATPAAHRASSRPTSMTRRMATTLLALFGTGVLASRPARANDALRPTPSDFEGPYRPLPGTTWGDANLMVEGTPSPGAPLRLVGRVLDTAGQPVAGARLYLWQANSTGRYNHPKEDVGHGVPDPGFRGFGTMTADAQGYFAFRTIVPSGYRRTLFGFLPWRFVPHIHVEVHAPARLLQAQIDVEPARGRHRAAGVRPDDSALMASAAFAPFRVDKSEVLRFDIVVERG
jgi:protocatechuate 3,4-dioxygenase, beta subunit